MKFKYTDEMFAFLREQYQVMRCKPLTEAFNARFGLNKTHQQIRATLKNHNITCDRKPGFVKGEQFVLFTQEQAQFIRDNYPRYSQEQLALEVNRQFDLNITREQINSFVTNHKIPSGRTGCFEKGIIPWNTGTKGVMKPNSGTFREGNIPGNIKPLGDERICTKDGYILIKVAETNPYTGAPTRYKAKHIVIWEKEHGPIPKRMIIRFIDGVKANCTIGNLMMISMAENQYLNKMGYLKLPEEVRPSMLALAKVVTRSRKMSREMEATNG